MLQRRLACCCYCIIAVLVCLSSYVGCQPTSSGAAAPLHVSLVKWSDLPAVRGAPQQLSAAASAAASLRAGGYPLSPQLSRPPLPRARDVLQQQQQQATSEVTSRAASWATPVPLGVAGPTLTQSSSTRRRRLQQQQQSGFQLIGSLAGAAAAVPVGRSALAAGPQQLLQAAGGVVTLHSLTPAGEVVRNSSRSVALQLLLQPDAAAGCSRVFDPSAAFDAAANRFLLSATCGGQGLILLAASATSDAAGAWFVFTLVADGAGTPLACTHPVVEAALADASQVSYNADGVFVTYRSVCPSSSGGGGVGLLALPKWAVFRGAAVFEYPMYTGADLTAALLAGSPAPAAAAAAAGCAQLVPVLPQGPGDVGSGEAWFVCEAVEAAASRPGTQRAVIVAVLLDTASLWQYGGPLSNASTPLLAAQAVELEAPTPPVTGLPLRQPLGAAALQHGTRPRAFWNGAAVMAGGKLWLATSTLVASDRSSPSYSRRPAVTWAELAVTPSTQGTDTCAQSRAGAASRQSWDAAKDYSLEWGAQHAHAAASAMTPASAAGAGGLPVSTSSADRVVRAAFAPIGLGAAAAGMGAAATVGLFKLGAQPCTCYACYWGGQYNRYGGYNGGALAGTGSGFASAGYFFSQGQMGRCQSFCTKCWYYGYPGHGFGNVGDDRQFLDVLGAAPFAANASGVSLSDGPRLDTSAASSYEAALAGLFAPCSRSGGLQAQVARQGVVTQGGRDALGLVAPALAVGRGGDVLLTFSYAGPGNASSSANIPAFAGVGAALIPRLPPAGGSAGGSQWPAAGVRVVRAGRGTIKPAAALTGGWAELSAMAVHTLSGTAFSANHYAAAAAVDASRVGSLITAWRGA